MTSSRSPAFSSPAIFLGVAGKHLRQKFGNDSGNNSGNISGNRPTYAAQPTTATPLASLQSAQADVAVERSEALRLGFNCPLPTSGNNSGNISGKPATSPIRHNSATFPAPSPPAISPAKKSATFPAISPAISRACHMPTLPCEIAPLQSPHDDVATSPATARPHQHTEPYSWNPHYSPYLPSVGPHKTKIAAKTARKPATLRPTALATLRQEKRQIQPNMLPLSGGRIIEGLPTMAGLSFSHRVCWRTHHPAHNTG